jgi:succinyl-CoA synthetase alpha subunit
LGILADSLTRVLIQGITGTQGSFHTQLMQQYGTKIVSGTSPNKGGTTIYDVPVYNTIKEAQQEYSADASIIFVPAPYAATAAHEALAGGIKTVIIITEHVPIKDSINIIAHARQVNATIVGPNTPGIITPGRCLLGIMPPQVFTSGTVGIVSRSGTLTYEIASFLSKEGIGQSSCIGLGGDPVTGLNFIETLKLFKDDQKTKAVVLVGEIGGNMEEQTANYIAQNKYSKPIVAYIAGRTAPTGKRMGHAGAIITGNAGTATTKIEKFQKAGVQVAQKLSDIPKMVIEATRL